MSAAPQGASLAPGGGSTLTPSLLLVTLAAGALGGFGLAYSTMVRPESVLAFLRFQDFGLLFVMGGAIAVTMAAYQLAPRILTRPVLRLAFELSPGVVDRRKVTGAAIFGIGWGLCGVCPGPALAALGTGDFTIVLALLAIFAGSYAHGRFVG